MTPEQEVAEADLQRALEAWADANEIVTPGWFIGDWHVVGTASHPDKPGRTLYWHGFSGGSQAPHITAGLIHYAQINNDKDIWNGEDLSEDAD